MSGRQFFQKTLFVVQKWVRPKKSLIMTHHNDPL